MLKQLFADLVPLLVEETVTAVRQASFSGPLARLKLWYYDTCAPICYFHVYGLTREDRERILANEGKNALGRIWDENGSFHFDLGAENPKTSPPMGRVYELMCSGQDELKRLGIHEKSEELSRLLAQELSRTLNAQDWNRICPVTDDFIVYSQNGTDYGCGCYEDLVASVPEEKLQLLRSRKLMGPGERYSSLQA